MGTATFSLTFMLTITDDTDIESNEITALVLDVENYDPPAEPLTFTVIDNDTPTVTLGDEMVGEGDDTVTVTATLDKAVTGGFTVDVSTVDGTATIAGGDYTAVSAETLSFAGTAGETETFTVPISDDSDLETDETFTLSLGNPAGTTTAVITSDTATVTITDNDPATVTLADATVGEGDGTVTVMASLDVAVPGGFTVQASTASGTARTADMDYTGIGGRTLSFDGMAGETETFTVDITDDSIAEGSETFSVSLATLGGTTLPVTIGGSATVTISDNDSATVTLGDETVGEGDGTVTVTATLNNAAVPGGFTVAASTMDGTATAGSDYTAITTTMLTFTGTAGEMQEFTVTVADDSDAEGDETFTVSLGNLAGTTATVVTTDTATVTITDNDTPSVTLGDETVGEGDGTVTVTATLNNVAVPGGFTVAASTMDGTATAGSDYTAVTTTLLTFAGTAGETEEFTVTVADDSDAEPDETFTVSLGNLAGTTVTVVTTDTATVTITDNEPPTVTLGDETAGEGDGTVTITATLSRAVTGGFTVDASTTDGTATTADGDYTALSGQTVTFAGTAGETQAFTVDITNDSDAEGDETFTVSLGSPAGTTTAVTTSDTATVTITDDDATVPLTLSLNPTSVSRSSGTATVSVTASVPADSAPATAVEVAVMVAGGGANPATAEEDFTPVPAFTIPLEAEATRATGSFVLTLADGDGQEDAETLTVSGTARGFVVAPATLTITDHGAAEVEAILPEIARATVLSTVGAIADRVGQVAAGATGGVRGIAPLPKPATQLAQALVTHRQGLNDGTVSLEEALSGLSLAGSPSGDGGSTGLWASAEYGGFSSKDDTLGEWDGESFQLQLGADHRLSDSDFLIGLAVSSSWGEISFDNDGDTDGSEIDTRLTGINPYVGWGSAELDANLWATLGYAAGELDHKAESATDQDLKVLSGAVGGSKRLPIDTEYEISVKGDVSATRITAEAAENTEEVRASANRLRLALEIGATEDLGYDLVSTRSIALGLRHDGGDGDTGTGAELDGQVSYIGPEMSVTGYGKLLFAHSSALREWSFGALVRYEPDQGRGLGFQLRPVYGTGNRQAGRIWDTSVADLGSSASSAEPEAKLSLDTGYGIPVLSGTALVTPYTGLDLAEGGVHTLRFGTRFATDGNHHLDLSANRTDNDGGLETGIGILASFRW